MTHMSRNEIQHKMFEIRDRVKANGQDNEIVKINVDLTLRGQEAINYQVLKLFSDEITDSQFVELMYLLGQKNAIEILKFIAPENGIQI